MVPRLRTLGEITLLQRCFYLFCLKKISEKKVHAYNETGWDLGPGTLCCSACTWTNVSSSYKIQRNYKGLKITVCMCSWGKLCTTRYKKTNCHFWGARNKSRGSGAKAGHCACPLHSAPPKGWADHLSHPSGWTPGPTPIRNQLAPPQGVSEQGKLLLVLPPLCCSRGPNKALPGFLVSSDQFLWIGEGQEVWLVTIRFLKNLLKWFHSIIIQCCWWNGTLF